MNDPLFEEKVAVAKKEEVAVNQIVKTTEDLFNAKVIVEGYNLVQGGNETRLILTLGISRKEVTQPMQDDPTTPAPETPASETPATTPAEDTTTTTAPATPETPASDESAA